MRWTLLWRDHRIVYQHSMSGGKTVWAVVWRRSLVWIVTTERARPRYRDIADAVWGEARLARTLATHYACPPTLRCDIVDLEDRPLRRYQHTQSMRIVVKGTRRTRVMWPADRRGWHRLFLLVYSQTLDERLHPEGRRA